MFSHLFAHWRIVALSLATTLLPITAAQAALGRAPQAVASAVAEGAPAARQLRTASPTSPYTVSTAVAPNGTVVQEFVNGEQRVFAVVWRGPVLPNLSRYFGEHYSAFQQAVQQKRAAGQRGGAVMTQQPDLVMLSRGRMGRFEGHAYIPSLVPAGLDIQTLLP
ncbi:DUF2844 domain-containing protein [Aquabacterium sp. G14]|uniref:DUF2844 domain-containing protein n=1 Tax=Aquabacterium sp. G14 TaxID=3130164 RepID=UPI0030A49B6C